MPTATRYEHVILNERGQPILEPSGFKIKFLVRDHLMLGLVQLKRPAEHLDHRLLDLGPGRSEQIHFAFFDLFDHRLELGSGSGELRRLGSFHLLRS